MKKKVSPGRFQKTRKLVSGKLPKTVFLVIQKFERRPVLASFGPGQKCNRLIHEN